MKQLNVLKQQFITPPTEFSPIPFWFWNDELSQVEIIRQIHDFHAKEVDGFVLHPRMGMPRTMPYLSEPYMDLVEIAVNEAAKLGMKVILYDEGMYPSGSANGMVVRQNPDFASRGLQMREYVCSGEGPTRIALSLLPEETLVSAQAVRKRADETIDMDSTVVLEMNTSTIEFTPPGVGDWSVLLFVDTPSKGTIRGVHVGQDDGEPDAPLAADLLNEEATQAFIALTHERYYERLSEYFGTTVFAMFTDEPDLLGRGHVASLKPWTRGFLDEFVAEGGRERDLPALWFEAGAETERIREHFDTVVRNRLAQTYYKPLADWCEAHRIALTGHPARSEDIGLLENFHIPGQDVVWRFIAPDDGSSLTGEHSTMGKCSSDAARHRGRQRNLNECFGVCGVEGGWSLSADNMKWYLDWLFVRGVNLISPHAFYYSIRDERRDERPPDVGPHNIWWEDYALFARYIKRMSWLMTDSKNGAEIAVLAGAARLPWQVVKPLYEQQIEFNYLEETLFNDRSRLHDGAIDIAGYRYKAIVIEDGWRFTSSSWDKLEAFVMQGGLVVELVEEKGYDTRDIGQIRVGDVADIAAELMRSIGKEPMLHPASEAMRMSRLTKDDALFYVIVNEGEERYEGQLQIEHADHVECWYPWTGQCETVQADRTVEGKTNMSITVERRECLIIAAVPYANEDGQPTSERVALSGQKVKLKKILLQNLSADWDIMSEPWTGKLHSLSSWTQWADMERFSGTVVYEKSFTIEDLIPWSQIKLDFGEAHELVHLWVNEQQAGVGMWAPYIFDIRELLRPGHNVLRVAVTNSLANDYDGKSLPSGLIGPVQLLGMR